MVTDSIVFVFGMLWLQRQYGIQSFDVTVLGLSWWMRLIPFAAFVGQSILLTTLSSTYTLQLATYLDKGREG